MPAKNRWFVDRFGDRAPLIGVVHLLPLPGAPRARLAPDHLIERALEDARAYLRGGAAGLIVENFGDAPFAAGPVEPHVVALMTRVALELRALAGERPVGVNVLRNDGAGALGVALAAGLDFIRVNVLSGVAATDQGLIEGTAAQLLRYRRTIGSSARIFADLDVKHSAPLREPDLAVQVDELVGRALADAVLVTGAATGSAPDPGHVARVKRLAGRTPVLVASGTGPDNAAALAVAADGFIVGTALKRGGRTEAAVETQRVRRLVRVLGSSAR